MQAHGVIFVFVFFILSVVFVFWYFQDHYLHCLPPWYNGVPGRGSVLGAEVNAGRLCIFHYFSCICIFVFLYLWDHYLHSLPPGFHGVPASGSVLGAEVNAGRRWNYIRGIIRLPSHCEFQISPWEPYKILRRNKRKKERKKLLMNYQAFCTSRILNFLMGTKEILKLPKNYQASFSSW